MATQRSKVLCLVVFLFVIAACGQWEARAAEPGKDASYLKLKVITNSIGMKLVRIPAGEFMMGSRESVEELDKAYAKYGADCQWFKHEHPRHRVKISKSFFMGMHEVTVDQFRQFVRDTDYKTDGEKDGKGGVGWNEEKGKSERHSRYTWRNTGFKQDDNQPVVFISWNDAVAFCKWLSGKEKQKYRLPTEAEWEYACRAGTTTRYHSGNDPEGLVRVGNVGDATLKARIPPTPWALAGKDGYVFTAPVGQFQSNAFGLYDMHGNVWEWCADWYGEAYYAKCPSVDPKGPASAKHRVLRGCSWGYRPSYLRSAVRSRDLPDTRYFDVGFRVITTVVLPKNSIRRFCQPIGHASIQVGHLSKKETTGIELEAASRREVNSSAKNLSPGRLVQLWQTVATPPINRHDEDADQSCSTTTCPMIFR